MDLRQSLTIEALGQPVKTDKCLCKAATMSAAKIAQKVFAAAQDNGTPYVNTTSNQWAERWLASDEFVLMEIQASTVAVPCPPKNTNKVLEYLRASAQDQAPIIVDLNKRGVGRTPNSGYIPPVIVVDGKHKFTAQTLQGNGKIMAWVGKAALDVIVKKKVEINASASKRVNTRIDTTMSLYGMGTPVARQDTGDGGAAPTMKMQGVKNTGKAMEPFTKGQKAEVQAEMMQQGPGPGFGSHSNVLKLSSGGGTGGMGGMGSGMNPNVKAGGPGSGRRKGGGGKSKFKPVTYPKGQWDDNWEEEMEAADTDSIQEERTGKTPQTTTNKHQVNDTPVKKSSPLGGSYNSPGSGVGPRLKPQTGAKTSDLSKVMGCDNSKMTAGKIPGVIRTRKRHKG